MCRRGRAASRDAIRLLDKRDADSLGHGDLGHAYEIARPDSAAGPVPQNKRPPSLASLLEVDVSLAVRRVELEHRLDLRTVVTIEVVERAAHDLGGSPSESPIDRTEHELADWELLMDAVVGALGSVGAMNVDELRRGIEGMSPDEYERASYYERWLSSVETILTEKGVLAPGELDARLAT